jgi:hypothetical protein
MRHAHIYLIAIVLLHVATSALFEAYFWLYVPDGGPGGDWMRSGWIYWLPLFGLLYIWCRVDAKDRHVELPFGASTLVAFLFPIGVSYYFFKTYPRRRALIQIALAAAFISACIAASWIGNRVAFCHYAFWTDPLATSTCMDAL